MPILTENTVPALLGAAARAYGDHPAVVDHGRTLSYRDLEQRVREVARGYLALGVEHGDRAAIWIPNRLEFILALLGAQYVGAAAVPLNTRFTGHEARAILERSRSRTLVVANRFLDKDYLRLLSASAAPDAVPSLPVKGLEHLERVIDVDGAASGDGVSTWADFIAAGHAVADAVVDVRAAAVTKDDLVDMMFTSGTTGQPKGVLSAHRQTLSVAHSWAVGGKLRPEDHYLIVNPLFHGFGYKAGLMASLVSGATIYLVETFDPDEVLDMIERDRISVLPGPPTIFTTLIDHPHRRDHDLSSLRFATCGASTVPQTLFRDMVEILGFDSVAQAYGLTECVVATMSRENEDFEHLQDTTGPAVVGVEIRVVDETNRPVPVGASGEIVLRGDNVTVGYFENEEANRAAFDDEGWFHSGDIGEMDEHGCVKITDRLKDMFIVGGFNVYPAEVEDVLRMHPAVNESAVIGVDDPRLGTVGRAYVLLLHDADPVPTEADLIAFCRERLANFKVPKEILFVHDYPRNATGKILKTALRVDAALHPTPAVG